MLEYVVRQTDFDEFLVEAVYRPLSDGTKTDIALIAAWSTREAAETMANSLNRLKYI